jgi:hypothetical protein
MVNAVERRKEDSRFALLVVMSRLVRCSPYLFQQKSDKRHNAFVAWGITTKKRPFELPESFADYACERPFSQRMKRANL